jgi:hypothetical protein
LKKAKFIAKEREELIVDSSIKFNSRIIELQEDRTIYISQANYNKILKLVQDSKTNLTSSCGNI